MAFEFELDIVVIKGLEHQMVKSHGTLDTKLWDPM